MSDKLVDSVVEKAMGMQEVAIEAAKQRIMEELTPKLNKLFSETVEKESKKVLEQADKDMPVDPNKGAGEGGEAEIDLDDLAKELEQGEEGGGEDTEDSETEGDETESIEDKVAKLETDVEEVKGDVAELKGEESAEGGTEEAPVEGESEEEVPAEGEEELGECVNINVDGDEEININKGADGGSSEPMDFAPLPADADDVGEEDEDEEDEMDEVKESRKARVAKAIKEMRIKKIRERIATRRAMKEQADVEKDTDVFIDIVDDTHMDEEEAPEQEDWEKTRPAFQEARRRNVMLKRRLDLTEHRLASERAQMLKARRIMSETALLNKKLTLVSKIFAEFNLSKKGKVNVLNEFDKAETIRESIGVYNRISKVLAAKVEPKKTVKEAKETPKVEPKKATKPLTEDKPKAGDPLTEAARPVGTLPSDRILDGDRLQRLAGITKK
jgi:hypothetical protein